MFKSKLQLVVLCFSVFGSLLYYFPLLASLGSLGIQDWDQNFAWSEFTRMSILQFHQFPFWDPYRCGGAVHFGNPQMSVLSIQTLFVLLFNTVFGIKISILVHGIIGFIGFYILSKQYKLSDKASIIAATIFSFSGITGSFLSTGMVVFSNFAYTPYILYSYNKGLNNRRWTIIAAFLFALSFYFGYHIPLLLIPFFILYSIFNFFIERKPSYLYQLVLFTLCFVIFSAPKLILSAQLISLYPRYIHDVSGFTLDNLFYFLLSRKQSLLGNLPVDHSLSIDENSLYVGIVPVLLFFIFFIKNMKEVRKHVSLLLVLICMILFMLGSSVSPSFYEALRQLPVFSSFRVAQRFRFDFIILFALIVGLGFDRLTSFFHSRTWRPVSIVVIGLIFVDLTAFSYVNFFTKTLIVNDNFSHIFNESFTQKTEGLNRAVVSYQNAAIPMAMEKPDTFSPWGLEYIGVRQNIGTIKCSDQITKGKGVLGSDNGNYRGEWYTEKNSRFIILHRWSPHVISLGLYSTPDKRIKDVLILNQNFFPGWYVEKNGILSKADNYNGLLSTNIDLEDKFVTFTYLPFKLNK